MVELVIVSVRACVSAWFCVAGLFSVSGCMGVGFTGYVKPFVYFEARNSRSANRQTACIFAMNIILVCV